MIKGVSIIKIILIFFYSMFLLLTVYNLMQQYRLKRIINAGICFNFAFILYYILIPLISIIIVENQPNNLNGMLLRISNSSDVGKVYGLLFSIIVYFIYTISYKIKWKSSKLIEISAKGYEEKRNIHTKYVDYKNYKTALSLGVLCLVLGLLSQFLIIDSLGGIMTTIKMGDVLRAFGADNNNYIPSNRLFALTLMPIVLAASYLFMYAQRIEKKLIVSILLTLSILSSLLYFLINAGRIAVLIFILPFFLDYAFRKTKHPFIYMAVISLISIALLGLLDDLFFYLSYDYVKESNSSGIISIINEFSFPYLNLINIVDMNEIYGLRWGVDFVTWIINIVPSNILSLAGLSKLETGYHLVTEYYLGSNPSGGIPTDLITLIMRQFSLLGVVIIPIILGRIVKIIDFIIGKIYSLDYYFMIIRIASIFFLIVPYGDIDSFIRNRFDMIIIVLFIMNIHRVKQKYLKFSLKE